MQKTKNGFLAEIVSTRANLIEVFLVAVFLALGVGFVTTSLPIVIPASPKQSLTLGIILCIVSIFYFLIRSISGRTKSMSYKALFTYDIKGNKPVQIPRYPFSQFLLMNLYFAFSENEALKTIWDKEPLSNFSAQNEEKQVDTKQYGSTKLICEATEYLVLEWLMWHLLDHFDDEKFRKKNLKEFTRNDISEVLLSNRFLELFSRPISDRVSMVKDTVGKKRGYALLAFYKWGEKAAKYHTVKLILPKGSAIRRPKSDTIQIETKKFLLTIKISFHGPSVSLPWGFLNQYLHLDLGDNLTEYIISVDVDVRFKLWTLLSGVGLRYYHWVDSFLKMLDQMISPAAFFNEIGWNTAMTIAGNVKPGKKTNTAPKNIKHKKKKIQL